ncbi:acetyltransferase (GNAT) family protein [Maribacter vaceletii]|uniref:Acetyltransferase (GNAT) family protein n=1 Tax=Maribacter vaceletii TaxID=1206816 RepID=A0A495E916_9FLAO|nr:GNAT family N-acetyltransferase [Maribacter vaceletii]RKR13395.1 acetyltransferase (GNAT) family protein [Maribacter vaceletii]
MKLVRTTSKNKDFIGLVKKLDAYLAITDGDEHAFYNQFNSIQSLKYVLVIYLNDVPVGCGAIKPIEESSMEIKRMYVSPKAREKGFATKILKELESWTKELNYTSCILETGIRQTEAVALYKKCNYTIIPNYGQYIGVKNSLCFKKEV